MGILGEHHRITRCIKNLEVLDPADHVRHTVDGVDEEKKENEDKGFGAGFDGCAGHGSGEWCQVRRIGGECRTACSSSPVSGQVGTRALFGFLVGFLYLGCAYET